MKNTTLIIILSAVAVFSGCAQRCDLVIEENKTLNDQNVMLKRQLEQAQAENLKLQNQLSTITGIDPNINVADIISVDSIKIADRSGFFDKDHDDVIETLIVYLKTYDQFGDAIKGAGAVQIEIWDLSLADDQAKLASWSINPNQLKNDWASTMMTNYYRLVFDISSIENIDQRDITLKVVFTDYLTGKIFEQQIVIKATTPQTSYWRKKYNIG